MRTREQKTEEVKLLRKKLGDASSVVLVDYRGLTVADANDLRGRLRGVGDGNIEYRVSKNTLVRLASEGTELETLRDLLVGPTALAFSYDEPSTLAKALVEYAKANENFEIKGGLVEGQVVDLASIRKLAELPSKDELRGMLAGMVQAPLRNLAGTIYALLGNLRNAVEQRQKQLETG
jgi:large subunit ribosomal protein L10